LTRVSIVIPSTLAGLIGVLGVQHLIGGRPVAVSVPAATAGTTSSSSPPSTGATSPATTPTQTRTAVGQDVAMQYGDVQLKVTVSGTKIVDISFVALNANDGKSQEIDQYAAPLLNQQAIAASSANIQGVSGATYTSDAYKQSLQSALDQLKQ
jgi:uncharacterized protein with FMN-binding domain